MAARFVPPVAVLEPHRLCALRQEVTVVPDPRLVHCDSLFVCNDGPHTVNLRLVGEVHPQNQGTAHNAPRPKVRLHLREGQGREVSALGVGHPHFEHVGVRPAPRPDDGLRVPLRRGAKVGEHGAKGGSDVGAGAEEVHGARCVGGGRAVVAVFDHHRPPRGVEELGETGDVFLLPTAVELDRLKPKVEGGLHIPHKAHVLIALLVGAVAVVPVPPRADPEGLRLGSHPFHVGEAGGVHDRVPRSVVKPLPGRSAVALLPAVVYPRRLVPQIQQAGRHSVHLARALYHPLVHGLDERLVDCTLELVPRPPSHWWGPPQSVVDPIHTPEDSHDSHYYQKAHLRLCNHPYANEVQRL
eukprot:Sspe_Gene.100491::Locus_75197_Transcript_1_1_Confidence_1.000_Length_1585::g.100491::m.100491